jgi:glyoxylase-like metal-dependent hydrolase (beta-lactamase superfamily II)/ferredoxin
MAKLDRRLPDQAEGEFYVDDSCIDCGACRWIAPASFGERSDISVVVRQPADAAERLQAVKALIACPTASIGTTAKLDLSAHDAVFPDAHAPGVYHCGYHARASYGAASWLIVRPEGNVLIDSPRFATRLVKRIEALGGVRTMFLTHRDDVADHQKFRDHFGCERVMHADDLGWNIRKVERAIEGRDPVRLDDDVLLIPVPGHTKGSTCLLYREEFLFAGDHVSWQADRGTIRASRNVCWYDWDELLDSMERLAAHRFEWILPGHGAPGHVPAAEMVRAIRDWVAHERVQA